MPSVALISVWYVGFRPDISIYQRLFPRSCECLPAGNGSVVQVKYTNRRGRKASRKRYIPARVCSSYVCF